MHWKHFHQLLSCLLRKGYFGRHGRRGPGKTGVPATLWRGYLSRERERVGCQVRFCPGCEGGGLAEGVCYSPVHEEAGVANTMEPGGVEVSRAP